MNPIEAYEKCDRDEYKLTDLALDGAFLSKDKSKTIYEIASSTEWSDEGKYSFKSVVLKHDGKYYKFDIIRSGSYYSEYTYEVYYPYEVKKKVKTVEVIYWE